MVLVSGVPLGGDGNEAIAELFPVSNREQVGKLGGGALEDDAALGPLQRRGHQRCVPRRQRAPALAVPGEQSVERGLVALREAAKPFGELLLSEVTEAREGDVPEQGGAVAEERARLGAVAVEQSDHLARDE